MSKLKPWQTPTFKAYHHQYLKDRRAEWKAAGLCGTCGAQPRPDRKTCDACIASIVESNRRRREKKRRKKSQRSTPAA